MSQISVNQGTMPATSSGMRQINPFSIDTMENTEKVIQESLINSLMQYNESRRTMTQNTLCTAPQALCLFNFMGNCSHSMIYGPFCPYHHQIILNKYITALTNMDKSSTRLVSVSLKNVWGAPFNIITSMAPIGLSYSEMEQALHFGSGVNNDERAIITRFYTIICNSPMDCEQDANLSAFKGYLNEVTGYFYDMLARSEAILDGIKVELTVSHKTREDLMKRSRWFNNIDSNHENLNVDKRVFDNTHYMYYVPITCFNLLDILTIMTYNLEPALNSIGYMPNCNLAEYYYVHGTFMGIRNSIDSFNATNTNFHDYPVPIAHALSRDVMSRVNNLDIMILPSFAEGRKNVEYVPMPTAIQKKDHCQKFDIARIRNYRLNNVS